MDCQGEDGNLLCLPGQCAIIMCQPCLDRNWVFFVFYLDWRSRLGERRCFNLMHFWHQTFLAMRVKTVFRLLLLDESRSAHDSLPAVL